MTLDPAVFRPEAIDEESRQFLDQLRALGASLPPIYKQTPQAVRAAAAGGRGPGGRTIVYSENAILRTIPGPAGEIPLRCFIPERIEGAYLYLHAGGWVVGTNDTNDVRLENIARTHNLAVFSVEYRLAPEHPYPAGPDDCEAAALWLAKNAQSEFGTDRLVIGGDSAGASLAVVSLLRLRDRHGIAPYRGAALGWGYFDAGLTPSAANWGDEAVILSTPALEWFSDYYVPPERRREPDVSPLYADLRGLPPALFTIGTMDPLLDDSLFMHARWLSAGNDSEIDVQPGGVHGLIGFPNEVGRRAIARQDAFFQSVLNG